MRTLLLALFGTMALAAELDLPLAAHQAREAAERQAAATRQRIDAARVALMADVQAATAAVAQARQDAQAAQAELTTARTQAEQQRALAAEDVHHARALVERALVAAKATAPAETDPVPRAAAAVAALEARMAALPNRLAEQRREETVLDRRGAPRVVTVLRLGEARAISLGADADTTGVLERTAEGTAWRVVGPPIPYFPGTMPLDPTGTVAGQAAPAGGVVAWLKAGRLFIWPILVTFAVGLGILAIRAAALARLGVDPTRLAAVADRLSANDAAGAADLVAARATPLDRILAVGIAARERSTGAREALVEEALLAESTRLHRGAALLLTLAGICPLLGLLGTVTGMIDLFSVIAVTGSGAARSVSGGISEALVTTQAGMLAAIPLLIGHAFLARAAEKREQLLEQAACRVLGLEESA